MCNAAVDLQHHSPGPTAGRQTNLSRLTQVTYDARRLASFRRVLGAILIVLGTPVVVLSRSTDPTIRHVLTILALVWLAFVLPMVRLLCVEWHNRRLADDLRVLVYGPRQP